jgi:hypothetical protein
LVTIIIALPLKGKWLHNAVLAGAADGSSDLNSYYRQIAAKVEASVAVANLQLALS